MSTIRDRLSGGRWLIPVLPVVFAVGFALGTAALTVQLPDTGPGAQSRLAAAVFGAPAAPVGQPGVSLFGARDASTLQVFAGPRGDLVRLGLITAGLLAAMSLLAVGGVALAARALRRQAARRRPAPAPPGGAGAGVSAEPVARRRARPLWRAIRLARSEGMAIFVAVAAVNIACAWYLVFHLNYVPGDAYARVANAFYVLFSRDPHLGAIGFIWAPLPSFLDLPVLLLRDAFPELVRRAFAGCIESSAFGAATAVLVNSGFRRYGMRAPLRWLFTAAYALNPLILYYSANGMSEAMLIFFLVASSLLLLRWTETRSGSTLAALAVVTALGTFVRYEAWVFAVVMGAAVAVIVIGRRVPWREAETRLLLYLLPVGYAMLLWIGANAVIQRDPLYFMRGPYANGKEAVAIHLYDVAALRALETWPAALHFVADEVVVLYPTFLLMIALVLVVALLRGGLRVGIGLVGLSLSVLALQVILVKTGQSFLYQRFYMTIIPFTFVIAAYTLGRLPGWWLRLSLALPVLVMLLVGNGFTLLAMADPRYNEEQPILSAAIHASPTDNPYFQSFAEPRRIADDVDGINSSGQPVLADSWMAFKIVMNSPHASSFIVTSDRDFEAAVNEPDVHHVAYFLVPEPTGLGTIDRINRLYPSFWRDGGGFGSLVADLGGTEHWRLYRIRGGSGR
jgi:hypothetical protein